MNNLSNGELTSLNFFANVITSKPEEYKQVYEFAKQLWKFNPNLLFGLDKFIFGITSSKFIDLNEKFLQVADLLINDEKCSISQNFGCCLYSGILAHPDIFNFKKYQLLEILGEDYLNCSLLSKKYRTTLYNSLSNEKRP